VVISTAVWTNNQNINDTADAKPAAKPSVSDELIVGLTSNPTTTMAAAPDKYQAKQTKDRGTSAQLRVSREFARLPDQEPDNFAQSVIDQMRTNAAAFPTP
jgi:hypothetical protein